jgi:OmcA/MtrC family decaheme c-type cytochrome
MNLNRTPHRGRIHVVVAGILAAILTGCGGGSDGGSTGNATTTGCGGSAGGAATADSSTAALTAATALNITVNSVCINSPPVVTFTVTNQAGVGMAGIVASDVRFNVAKLVPGLQGDPPNWQNYINRARSGAVQGSQERTAAGYAFGTLVNHGDGSYTYTFATDIRDPAANPCPAPCTDADGNALNISYQPNLTHRVTIQQGNSAYPKATGVLDFVPAGTAGSTRDIVMTSTCNQCHYQLTAHGTRVDTRLCDTCHNPGSWVAGTPNTTVDFKVMIHKIHYNIYNGVSSTNPNYLPRTLPSVDAGYPYMIGSTDFSTPTFTQDARNCAKCHDGTLSAQGDNWKNEPSIASCGACHDNVYFGALPDPAKPYQTVAHPIGPALDGECKYCHAPGEVADVTVAHTFPARLKAAAAKFQFNIISAAPTTPNSAPVITFSVTDPTNGNKPYDITADAPFTAGSASTLNVRLGWTTAGIADIGNDGNGQDFGQPISMDALTTAVPGGTAGTYTVTSAVAIPLTQTGTLRVMMDGHPAGDVTTPGTFADRLAVKSVFKDFAITGAAVARRIVVDIAKCNVCHDVLSLHGTNRTNEPQVCAVCHNPNGTDKSQRPPGGGIDGKAEEAIDFRTMIHGIHAGQASNGGFREKGLVVYGFNNSVNDFSNVVFPGELSNCTACHTSTSYQLTGIWASPTASGILGTTTSTGASATDAADNLRTTPTAAVCTSCHDSMFARVHVTGVTEAGQFSVTQATINASIPENCILCHAPGGPVDVKKVHGVK